MGIVTLSHARIGVAQLAGDHRHWHSLHGKDRSVRVPLDVEADRRDDARPCTGIPHRPQLLGALPPTRVMTPEYQISRRSSRDQTFDKLRRLVGQRDVAYVSAL